MKVRELQKILQERPYDSIHLYDCEESIPRVIKHISMTSPTMTIVMCTNEEEERLSNLLGEELLGMLLTHITLHPNNDSDVVMYDADEETTYTKLMGDNTITDRVDINFNY